MTDAIAALGFKDGIYRLGQLDIEVQKQRAYILGTETLCGSTADMATCVRRFKEATGILKIFVLSVWSSDVRFNYSFKSILIYSLKNNCISL